jgi:hypothetical protein
MYRYTPVSFHYRYDIANLMDPLDLSEHVGLESVENVRAYDRGEPRKMSDENEKDDG